MVIVEFFAQGPSLLTYVYMVLPFIATQIETLKISDKAEANSVTPHCIIHKLKEAGGTFCCATMHLNTPFLFTGLVSLNPAK